MTEDDAKKKWCPMVRTGLVAGMAVNHHCNGNVDSEMRCIASDCMMWRWMPEIYMPEGETFISQVEQRASSTDGYCGLAGTFL